jgi:hypothetical protein
MNMMLGRDALLNDATNERECEREWLRNIGKMLESPD